ncbi:MAG: hypothetical protein ACYDDU_13150 [Dermatophilaceae bacterium]
MGSPLGASAATFGTASMLVGADEPTSRRADEPTRRRADAPTSRLVRLVRPAV